MLSGAGKFTLLITLLLFTQLLLPSVFAWSSHPTDLHSGWLKTITASSDPSVSVTIPNIPVINVPKIKPPEIILRPMPIVVTPPIVTPPGGDWMNWDFSSFDPKKFAQNIMKSILNAFKGFINQITAAFTAVGKTIYNAIVGAVATIGQFFVDVASTVANGILTVVEALVNMPSQFLNGYWDITIGSLVDALAGFGPLKPFIAPIAYTALITETIPVVYALGYLGKFVIAALRIVVMAVI